MILIYLDHSNSRSLQSTFINFSTTLEDKDLKPSCSCKKVTKIKNIAKVLKHHFTFQTRPKISAFTARFLIVLIRLVLITNIHAVLVFKLLLIYNIVKNHVEEYFIFTLKTEFKFIPLLQMRFYQNFQNK